MPSHEAFLRQIIAQPDDDAPRLIYADWLEEQGDRRAEFIRLQCALGKMEEYDRDYVRLRRREKDLLRRFKSEWLGPLEAMTFEAKLHRGFVREVTLGPRQFLKHQEALFRLAPIERVNLARLNVETAREITACENANVVRELRVAGNEISENVIDALLASGAWKRLQSLIWRANVNHARSIVFLNRVRELALEALAFDGVSLRGARGFGFVRGPGSLRSFSLPQCGIDPSGARDLASGGWLDGVRALNVSNNELGIEGLDRLAHSPLGKTLERIDLTHNYVDGFALHRFLTALGQPQLKWLRLAQNRLAAGLAASFSLPAVRHLEHLDLSYIPELDAASMQKILEACRLVTLRLYHCRIGDAGAAALVQSPQCASLRLLDLNDNHLTDAAADAILNSPHWANLSRLELLDNKISRDRRGALRRRLGPGVCSFSR